MKSGILLVNKPVGISSFDVITIARKKLNTKKIGHAGTLDPFASGLLILAIGDATKALSHFILSEKKYRTKILFGVDSDTLDPEGELEFFPEETHFLSNKTQKKSDQEPILKAGFFEKTIEKFRGEISQIPPKFSALKINGKRACDRMRDGEEVEMKERKVKVHNIEIVKSKFFGKNLEFEIINSNLEKTQKEKKPDGFSKKDKNFKSAEYLKKKKKPIGFDRDQFSSLSLELSVSSGFYVRSFCRDFAAELGAHGICGELERISTGDFSLENAAKINDISEEKIQPLTPEMFELPVLELKKEEYERIVMGQRVPIRSSSLLESRISKNKNSEEKFSLENENVLYSLFYNDIWCGFGEMRGNVLHPKKVVPVSQ